MIKGCFRGVGRIARKIIPEILSSNQVDITYISDANIKICNSYIENVKVISPQQAEKLYPDEIDIFIISWAFGEQLVKVFIKELIDAHIPKDKIILYHNKHFISLSEISTVLPFTLADYMNTNIINQLIQRFTDESYESSYDNIVVCGTNWLSDFVYKSIDNSHNVIDYNSYEYNASNSDRFIICDNGYLFDDIFRSIPYQHIIYLYDLVMGYFFGNAQWFNTITQEKKKTGYSIIATGTSCIRSAIKQDGILNLSNTAQDLFFDFMLLKHYVQKSSGKVKTAVMGLHPCILNYDVNLYSKEITLLYYPELHSLHSINNGSFYEAFYNCEINKVKKTFRNFDIEECFYDFYFKNKLKILDFENKSFSENNMSDKDKKTIKSKFDDVFRCSCTETTIEDNKKIIIEYLKFCKANSIEVVAFFPPFSRLAKEIINNAQMSDTKDFIEECKKEYSLKICDLSEIQLNDEYFFDYAHLNGTGADFVMKQLSNYIKEN